jgi:Bacteriophage holin of superfamily 6 (Holin_LLH)
MNVLDSIGIVTGPILASIIVAAVIATAAYIYQILLQKMPANVRIQVEHIAGMVVQATEQRYSDSQVATGRDKKQAAMDALSQICSALHIPLDVMHASAAIEAAVYELNQAQQQAGVSEKPTAVQPSVQITLPESKNKLN